MYMVFKMDVVVEQNKANIILNRSHFHRYAWDYNILTSSSNWPELLHIRFERTRIRLLDSDE